MKTKTFTMLALKLIVCFVILFGTEKMESSEKKPMRTGKSDSEPEKKLLDAIARKYEKKDANVVAEVVEALQSSAFMPHATTVDDIKRIFGDAPFTLGPNSIGVKLQKGFPDRPDVAQPHMWYLVCIFGKDLVMTKFVLQYGVTVELVGYDLNWTHQGLNLPHPK